VGSASARRGHYYAGPGNEFWPLLYACGLTLELLTPEHEARVVEFGIGLTDLNKTISRSSDRRVRYDVPAFVAKIEQY
jgi:TDG/mug DNA glycosylase family protein